MGLSVLLQRTLPLVWSLPNFTCLCCWSAWAALGLVRRCCDRMISTRSRCLASVVRCGCMGRMERWVLMPSPRSLCPLAPPPANSLRYVLVMVTCAICLTVRVKWWSCLLRVGFACAEPGVVVRGSGFPANLYSTYNSSQVVPAISSIGLAIREVTKEMSPLTSLLPPTLC